MKKLCVILISLVIGCVGLYAHDINNYKYVVIEHQEDMPKDIEARLAKEFPTLGFVLLDVDAYEALPENEKNIALKAVYRSRQSAQCLFRLRLLNIKGEEVYEDEQVGAAGFMSRKNDRQSAIKKIFKQLKKLDYKFEPSND